MASNAGNWSVLAAYWRRRNGPLANAVSAQEGYGRCRNGGTSRAPRTAEKEARHADHRHGTRATPLTRAIDGKPEPRDTGGANRTARWRAARGYYQRHKRRDPLFGKLLASGHYDEYRRAFHDSTE